MRFLIVICSLFLLGCNSKLNNSFTSSNPPVITTPPVKGYVTLSFDDANVGSWYENRDVFINHGIKVTFFISRYDRDILNHRNPRVHDMFLSLMHDGHEIGYHTVNHKDAVLLYESGMTWEQYYSSELQPDLLLMRQAGCAETSPSWCPTTFAYPHGRDVPEYTEAMRETGLFKAVRNFSVAEYPQKIRTMSYLEMGYSVDSHRLNFDELSRVFERLQLVGGVVVLATHEIVVKESTNKFSITRDNLIKLISLAHNYDLEFITYSETVDMFTE